MVPCDPASGFCSGGLSERLGAKGLWTRWTKPRARCEPETTSGWPSSMALIPGIPVESWWSGEGRPKKRVGTGWPSLMVEAPG